MLAAAPSRYADLCAVTFRYSGSSEEPVALVGSFNHWDERAHPLQWLDGEWSIKVYLPRGTYHYLSSSQVPSSATGVRGKRIIRGSGTRCSRSPMTHRLPA